MINQQQLKILMVDDDLKAAERLSTHLKESNIFVQTTQSARAALSMISSNPVDILITAIHMTEMNGFDLIRQVLKVSSHTQIIMISIHLNVNNVIEAMRIGAVDFLQKPVSSEKLRDTIQKTAKKCFELNNLRLAYTALEKEKELLAVTMRSIGDGVIATDLDGRVSMINRVAEDLTGWPANDAIGQPLTDVFYIINERTRKVCENPVDKVLDTGHIIGLANHTALIARDGTERSIADSAAPIRNRSNQIIGIVLVFRDVTLENVVNKELSTTKKLESIGILAGGIAHDFNNILTSIMGNINLAKSIIEPSHEIYDYLDSAESASKRASKLTKQLLTFSKGGEPIRQLTSVYDIVRESSNFILSGSDINCRIDRDADLWGVEVDKDQISQVVQNLILNARQAMPEGGTIHIVCENYRSDQNEKELVPLETGDYVRVTIEDEGVGIHPEHMEKVFDPYFSTKQKGSGLGLAVTHSIIKKHFGYITCDSIPARGSTFTMYLPATREIQVLKTHKPIKRTGHAKIMIMDDEQVVREIASRMLQKGGYSTVQAEDGNEALKKYKETMNTNKPLDLVIMDLTVPGGMGGLETIKKLKQLDPNARAIVSSGYSNDPVMADHEKYGFIGVLDKPYLKSKLLQVVAEAIALKSS